MSQLHSKLWFLKRRLKVNASGVTNKVILVTGMPRSGSTVIYNIIQLLLTKYSGKIIRSGWINDFKFRVTFGNIIILKIHDHDSGIHGHSIIHSSRDLKEVAASQLVKEKSLPSIEDLTSYHRWDIQWKKRSSVVFQYQDLENLETLTQTLARVLDIRSFDMNIVHEHLDLLNKKTDQVYDPKSLRYANHQSGAGEKWKNLLTKDYIEAIDRIR